MRSSIERSIHTLTDNLQEVISNIELDRSDAAMFAARRAVAELRVLKIMISVSERKDGTSG